MTGVERMEMREALAAELHKQWQLAVQRLVELGVDLAGVDTALTKALYKDYDCLTGLGPYKRFAQINANNILTLLDDLKVIEATDE